jgi:hypothetical protein
MTVPTRRLFWSRRRVLAIAIASAVIAVFLAANTHLIYVAFAFQSDCVHTSTEEGAAMYRAAKPSC